MTTKVKEHQPNQNEWFDEWDLPAGTSGWKVDEAVEESVVDGVNILARAVGPMFLIDAASRNKRHYSKELWEKAIQRTESIRENGLMLGTIGHDQPLDDTALLQGKASHRVSKLWIDEETNLGFGEILVLNTTAGRNLNAYLRGGTNFPVSSRASGEYTGRKVNGNDELDAETYLLQTFDFVQVPGVAQATPRLVESHGDANADQPENNNQTTVGDTTMSDNTQTILEQLSHDKGQLQNDLDKALAANKQLESEKAVLEHKVDSATASSEGTSEELAELKAKLEELTAQVGAYVALGSAEELSAKVESHGQLTAQLEELGSLDDVKKVMENTEKFINANGSFEEIVEKLGIVAAYEDLGEPEKLDQALDMLEAYIALGTVEEIQQVFEASMEMAKVKAEEAAEAQLQSFVKETGASQSVAEKLLGKMDFEDAKEVAESLIARETDEEIEAREKDEAVNARYTKGEEGDEQEETNEDAREPVVESRANSFFKSTVVK